MIKLFGKSQIMKGDETFEIEREPTRLGNGVNLAYGKLIKANPICFKVIGNIQPMTQKDLLLVPEGDRTKEQYWLYLPSFKLTVQQGLEVQDITALQLNDRMKRNCIYFQVQSLEDWGSYSRARIMKIDVGPFAENQNATA